MTRRDFLVRTVATGTLLRFGDSQGLSAAGEDGRLTARPRPATISAEPGEHKLGLGAARDGLIYVPK